MWNVKVVRELGRIRRMVICLSDGSVMIVRVLVLLSVLVVDFVVLYLNNEESVEVFVCL